MNPVGVYVLMTTMMNAMSEKTLIAAKSVSRSLRQEGAFREAVNHKIAQVVGYVPANLRVNPTLKVSAWIRDSLAQNEQKAVDWVASTRPQDSLGNWLPKGAWFAHTFALRDREQTKYEPRITLAGFAAVKGRSLYGGPKSHLVASTLRMRKGSLSNGNNKKVWCYSVSRKCGRLAAAYSRMKQTLSVTTAAQKAAVQGQQKWQPVVFFNAIDQAGEEVFTMWADAAYADALTEAGVKVRSVPFIAAGGEN